MWGAGPVATTLRRVLREGASPRVYPGVVGCNIQPYRTSAEVLHMPIGSAMHMSSMSEPLDRLYKEGGTIEGGGRQSCLSVQPLAIAQAAGALDRQAVRGLLGSPWRTVSVFGLSPESQRIWRQAVPWIMRQNPEYFCFELPLGLP